MKIINTIESIKNITKENEIVLLYFGSEDCDVCNAVKPKTEIILNNYPKIVSVHVEVDKAIEAAAQYHIFTIPVILVFIEGKEIIREARNFSMKDLEKRINRYYDLLFN